MPIVPLLLLPLGMWMESKDRRAWVVVAPLAAIGFVIQILHVAVNFAYVYNAERWPDFQPPLGFLFIPRYSPILAFGRAFAAHDFRVDMWLVNVYRNFGVGFLLLFLLPLCALLVVCASRLRTALRAAA
jgi:hypothetical protein